MSTPNSCDMKPRTEKTAKPATMLVKLFSVHKAKVSLELEKMINYPASHKQIKA